MRTWQNQPMLPYHSFCSCAPLQHLQAELQHRADLEAMPQMSEELPSAACRSVCDSYSVMGCRATQCCRPIASVTKASCAACLQVCVTLCPDQIRSHGAAAALAPALTATTHNSACSISLQPACTALQTSSCSCDVTNSNHCHPACRSVRIFAHNGGHSREVYHTKRMQRVFATRFSGDGSYVFSGSDDMNVRIWKVTGALALFTVERSAWTSN